METSGYDYAGDYHFEPLTATERGHLEHQHRLEDVHWSVLSERVEQGTISPEAAETAFRHWLGRPCVALLSHETA